MKAAKRGYGSPRTLRSKVDRAKARTPQGALLELTRLTQEKMRLRDEVARWEHRIAEIRERLQEIAALETLLYRFIDPPGAGNGGSQAIPHGPEPIQAPALADVNEVTIGY